MFDISGFLIKKSYLGMMGFFFRFFLVFIILNSVMWDFILYGLLFLIVSDDKEFISIDEELFVFVGFGDDRDDEEE